MNTKIRWIEKKPRFIAQAWFGGYPMEGWVGEMLGKGYWTFSVGMINPEHLRLGYTRATEAHPQLPDRDAAESAMTAAAADVCERMREYLIHCARRNPGSLKTVEQEQHEMDAAKSATLRWS